MITNQLGSFPVAFALAMICGGFFITLCVECYKAFVQNHGTQTLNKDMTILGFVLATIISIFIFVYGYVYYDHFQGLIEANKEFNQMQREAHSDSEILNIFDWYERKIQKLREAGQLTSFEEEVMRNNYGQEYEVKFRYIFPFKSHNIMMFFSLYYTIVAGCLFAIYIMPTKSAFENNHPQKNTILWLNILTGWTVIGWLVLLMWTNPGSAAQQIPAAQSVQEEAPPPTAQAAIPVKPQRVRRENVADRLMQLKKLRDADVITQEEYEQKKQELLKQI